MGLLYQTIQRIDEVIERRALQGFRTRGLIALKAGFSLALIEESTPDDPAKVHRLKEAAREVLGEAV